MSVLFSALYAKCSYYVVLCLQSVLIIWCFIGQVSLIFIQCFICKASLLVSVLYAQYTVTGQHGFARARGPAQTIHGLTTVFPTRRAERLCPALPPSPAPQACHIPPALPCPLPCRPHDPAGGWGGGRARTRIATRPSTTRGYQ